MRERTGRTVSTTVSRAVGTTIGRVIGRTWWTEFAAYLALGVLASTALCLAASVLLMGLPHGWQAATTWSYTEDRFVWLAGRLVPASVVAYLVVRLRRHARQRRSTGNGSPTSTRYRGRHL
ncbi:hypothetical protein [Streptomyces sp. NPDC047070]|uniref:hypothetical protein n=1 Tax=Streptomyces sp. NPDC047070 TaxID=3154923 RepID=UPI003451ED89